MNAFIQQVLQILQQGIGQAIAVLILTGLGIVWAWSRHKRRYGGEKPFPWKKTVLILLLIAYLAVVDYATLRRMYGGRAWNVSFHLFRAWREAWNNFSVTAWLNVLLNIAMFVPLGVLLPLVWKRCRKWYVMLAAGFGLSLWIELVQFFTGRGILDVDDLFTNTLGAMLGFFLLMTVLSLRERQWKGAACFGLLLLVPLGAIGSIFLVYETQAYGNLSSGYTYRLDTSGIEWVLDCELGTEERTVPVYKMEKPTQESADAIRDTFAQALGVEFERTDYYDESTMYMDQMGDGDCANFLTVRRLDGSYDYSLVGDDTLSPAETDRETIEALLLGFGITVPAEAEFSYLHSGWHCFTADGILEGDTMIRGELRCQYNEGGVLSGIENDMIVCARWGEAEILSPAQAFEQVKNGQFSSESFARADPRPVFVRTWTLDYQVDTKGFCQPVYRFELAAGNSEYTETIMVPALES